MLSTILKVLSHILPIAWKFYKQYKEAEQKRKADAIRKDPLEAWDKRYGK